MIHFKYNMLTNFLFIPEDTGYCRPSMGESARHGQCQARLGVRAG